MSKVEVFNVAVYQKVLLILTFFWIVFIANDYSALTLRPESLYYPIWGFQKVFLPNLITPFLFYSLILSSLVLTVFCFFNKRVFVGLLLTVLVAFLNAVRWSYGATTHVGHVFILAHLFSFLLPDYFKVTKVSKFDRSLIKLSGLGVLITYSMAGFWKFLSLFVFVIRRKYDEVSWLHKDAVELNAIVNRRSLDNTVSNVMLSLYEVPHIWEVLTVFVFTIQFTVVLAVFYRKYSYLVLIVLVSFHLYNVFFLDIVFYLAPLVLISLLLPYHLILNVKFRNFKIEKE